MDIFFPFISRNGDMPHETLEIVPIRKRLRVRINKDLEIFTREVLKRPLLKFPFSIDPEQETDHMFGNIKPFLRDARFKGLLGDIKKPEDVVIYPLNKDGLIFKFSPNISSLFIKDGYRQMSKVGTICEAIYFTTSIHMPIVDSCMLHGVGIRRNGEGHLFLGLPGDGKTTLAGLSSPEGVISDDGIIARRGGSGYYLDPAPLDQSYSFKDEPRTCPAEGGRLAMGFFLKKDERVYMERINPTDACSIMLKNHIHFFRYFPNDSVKRAFSLITDLCRKVPFYKLHFKKDDSFWSVIDRERDKIT